MWVHYAAKRSSRTIPLPSVAQYLLTLYIKNAQITDGAPLFPQVGHTVCYKLFRRYRSAAGIAEAVRGPHVLRHTFTTHSANGQNLRWLQEYLGHSDLRQAQVYIHRDRSRDAELINRFPQLLEGGPAR